MKRISSILWLSLGILFVIIGFESCTSDIQDFDETLLYGTWQDGSSYEKYLSDGSGKIWDTSDDVTEEEAQNFTWTLVGNQLTQIHLMEISGAQIPVVYTVVTLNSSTLIYKDSTGKQYYFTKVN